MGTGITCRTISRTAREALLPLFALVGLAAGATAEEGEPAPWPREVPGHVRPAPGEHPRLFFRRGDLPELRRRAATPGGRAIVRRLKELVGVPAEAGSGDLSPKLVERQVAEGKYTMSHAAGYGFLYQLTGDTRYAALGRKAFELALEGTRDRDDRYSFRKPKGALRAGPSLGWYAVGYDLCYDGWDEEFRRRITEALESYDEGKHMSFEELARGSRHMPASNHWGMQVGGGALALLAIQSDPGVDPERLERLLAESEKAMIRNMTEGFGDHGWFPEGDGTAVMASFISFVPALQAWKVAGGRDFITPRPNARWLVLRWLLCTIPRDGKPDFPARGAYPHNVWSFEGVSGSGLFSEGFGILPDDEKAALLWLYHRIDYPDDAPYETQSEYPHRAALSLVNWPFGAQEINPARVMPRAVRDETYGVYMLRNRWKDENDVLVTLQTRNTRGWHRAKTGGRLWVWGHGKKLEWGRMTGKTAHWEPSSDGSAVLTMEDGTSLAVDFSGEAGVDAMLVMTGPGAGEGTTVELGDRRLSFLFISRGDEPTPERQGDAVLVGEQTVRVDAGGNLVLGTAARSSGRP